MDEHFHCHEFGSAVELVEDRDAVFAGMSAWWSKSRLLEQDGLEPCTGLRKR